MNFLKMIMTRHPLIKKQEFVEIHQPDGKPDILQQMEHGLLSIVGGL